MEQQQLNNIWDNILKGTYTKKADELRQTFVGELFGSRFVYPEKQHSDEVEDIMSIPNNDGTKRESYIRKKNENEWHKQQ